MERIGPALCVATLESSCQLVDRHIKIMKLDVYTKFSCFTPLLIPLASSPQALFKDYALPTFNQLLPECPQLIFKQVVKHFIGMTYFKGGVPIISTKSYCWDLVGQLTRQGGLPRSRQPAHQYKLWFHHQMIGSQRVSGSASARGTRFQTDATSTYCPPLLPLWLLLRQSSICRSSSRSGLVTRWPCGFPHEAYRSAWPAR
jgi:hypothetical protein